MDLQNTIIQNVKQKMMSSLTDEQMDKLTDALTIALQHVVITEECTAVTVSDNGPLAILKRYIAVKRVEGLSEKTLTRYYDICWEMLQGIGKPVGEITTNDLRYFLSIRRERDNVSNRTLDGMRRIYSAFFGWLAAEQLIEWNPTLALKKIKYKKQVKKSFSPVEMQKIREACKTDRDLALIDFLYYSGCRVSEVVGIDVSDIDFENKSVTILGKGNKERTVYLADICMMHLAKYLNGRFFGALFMGKGTERVSKTGIEAAVKRIGASAGVANVHCHRFRRTLATNLIQKGMNILTVAQILGHADLRTTQEYCYVSAMDVQSAYRSAFAA